MFGTGTIDEQNQINQTADWIIVWQSVITRPEKRQHGLHEIEL